MEPVDFLPSWLAEVLFWVYYNQTLIAGLLALAVAIRTVSSIRDQINLTQATEADRIKRRQRAARAALPATLSQIHRYAQDCINVVRELERLHNDNASSQLLDVPNLPDSALAALSTTIESVDPRDAKKLAGLLAQLQVQNARLVEAVEDFKIEPGTRERVYHRADFVSLYFDILSV
ncbi:MAG: hypothetical protein NXH72_12020 [Hyphomonadaceae bacterium]|nr:hypothetical protein [Hyphomonadaceae bacterium]